jgi:signal transduction histidine kinase
MYIEMMMDGYNRQLVNLAMAGAALCEFLIVYTCISWVRKIKESYFMKSALCYKILHKIWKKMKQQKEEWEIWRDKSDSTLNLREKEMKRKKKSLIITILSGTLLVWFVLLMAVTFEAVPFILADIVLALFLLRFFRKLWKDYQKEIQDLLDLEKVLQQIYEISNGNLMARTEIEPDSLYYKATKDLSEIGQGMAKSVEEQLKSERMKIDLITNVSHDLKTPLTSIISYVDLLSKDESLSEEAHDYVSILEKKAERLKNIVIDLFDLAKSTSGNAEVNLSIMNMEKLIEQTLIEMEDKVQESGFEIITDYNVERPLFEGDVNRMYRVVQNLLENALKYSLAGSRIYISISEEAEKLKLSIKNTASYRMKFTEEEILERFTRGDESRTTEGSGLGLSIAENFTKLCGGEFKVKIDGDQFTTEIQFAKKYEV